MDTPWGTADDIEEYEPGLTWVGTPSHGGLMITKEYAKEHLSKAAQKRGEAYDNYLCYEEDCAFAIPYLELLPRLHDRFFAYSTHYTTFHERMEYLIKVISRYNADYLIERGIKPEPKAYADYLAHRESDGLRSERSPDLIVSASGDWHEDCKEGETRVITADCKVHFVTSESYAKKTCPNLLSNCVLTR